MGRPRTARRGSSPSCVRATGMPRTLPWDGQWSKAVESLWTAMRGEIRMDNVCRVSPTGCLINGVPSDNWSTFEFVIVHQKLLEPPVIWQTDNRAEHKQSRRFLESIGGHSLTWPNRKGKLQLQWLHMTLWSSGSWEKETNPINRITALTFRPLQGVTWKNPIDSPRGMRALK